MPSELENLPDLSEEIRLGPAYQTLVQSCRIHISDIVLQYWEIGRHIHQYYANTIGSDRYGKRVILCLSEDLEIDKSTLYYAWGLYRADPERQILDQLMLLPWGRARRLVPFLRNPKNREFVLSHIQQFREMSVDEFFDWLPQEDEATDSPNNETEDEASESPEDEPENENISPLSLAYAKPILSFKVANRPGQSLHACSNLLDAEGFIAVVRWADCHDPQPTIQYLRALINRIRIMSRDRKKSHASPKR